MRYGLAFYELDGHCFGSSPGRRQVACTGRTGGRAAAQRGPGRRELGTHFIRFPTSTACAPVVEKIVASWSRVVLVPPTDRFRPRQTFEALWATRSSRAGAASGHARGGGTGCSKPVSRPWQRSGPSEPNAHCCSPPRLNCAKPRAQPVRAPPGPSFLNPPSLPCLHSAGGATRWAGLAPLLLALFLSARGPVRVRVLDSRIDQPGWRQADLRRLVAAARTSASGDRHPSSSASPGDLQRPHLVCAPTATSRCRPWRPAETRFATTSRASWSKRRFTSRPRPC